jgi:hypothetical protein
MYLTVSSMHVGPDSKYTIFSALHPCFLRSLSCRCLLYAGHSIRKWKAVSHCPTQVGCGQSGLSLAVMRFKYKLSGAWPVQSCIIIEDCRLGRSAMSSRYLWLGMFLSILFIFSICGPFTHLSCHFALSCFVNASTTNDKLRGRGLPWRYLHSPAACHSRCRLCTTTICQHLAVSTPPHASYHFHVSTPFTCLYVYCSCVILGQFLFV